MGKVKLGLVSEDIIRERKPTESGVRRKHEKNDVAGISMAFLSGACYKSEPCYEGTEMCPLECVKKKKKVKGNNSRLSNRE